jgi:hypothetical protein
MSDDQLSRKEIIDLYEQGKHRRYSLLFSVNGGAFAIARLVAGGSAEEKAVLGGMTLWLLALAMSFFSAVMTYDTWSFGVRMRALDDELFGNPGRVVLVLLGAFLVVAWLIVGFWPVPSAAAR